MHHDTHLATMPLGQLEAMALEVAARMNGTPAADATPGATGGGSAHRNLPEDVHRRFIEVRSALIERGIFDPVLIRFDTATAPQASTAAIAQQLTTVAEGLSGQG